MRSKVAGVTSPSSPTCADIERFTRAKLDQKLGQMTTILTTKFEQSCMRSTGLGTPTFHAFIYDFGKISRKEWEKRDSFRFQTTRFLVILRYDIPLAVMISKDTVVQTRVLRAVLRVALLRLHTIAELR